MPFFLKSDYLPYNLYTFTATDINLCFWEKNKYELIFFLIEFN